MKTKYTKKILQPIVDESTSFTQVVKKLGLGVTGGNQSHIKKIIVYHQIDTSHFLGQGHNKGKTWRSYPLSEYLENKREITSHRLKVRLIKEGYFKELCCKCMRETWLGEKIPLELHHLDRDHYNNKLENLTILCPNCHSIVHRNMAP